MYFVDRKKIAATLQYLLELIALFEASTFETKLEVKALERIVHQMIEAILDVGNAMIDGFIMRDPGSFDDIIDILIDEKVVTSQDGEQLKRLLKLRKPLVQDYLQIDHAHVASETTATMLAIKQFAPSVERYLEQELGPVSAFKNDAE